MEPELIELTAALKAFAILNIIPVVLFALGSAYLEQSLTEMAEQNVEIDREAEAERIRFLSLVVVLVQFAIFLGATEVREAFPIYSQLIFVISSLIQFIVQSATERNILPPKDNSIGLMNLLGRVIASWLLSAATYFFTVVGAFQGITWLASISKLSTSITSGLLLSSGAIGIILGLVLSYLLGPIHLRIMFPSSKNTDENLGARIHSYFKKARLTLPKIRIIEIEQFKFFPIMLSGTQLGRGPLRPVLYLTAMMLKNLTETEIGALLSIQMSRIILHHERKRLIYSFSLIFISSLIAIPVINLFNTIFEKGILLSSVVPSTVIVSFLVCFTLIVRQSKKHSFEADVYCLEKLNISPEDLFSAIRKTHPENHPTHFEAELRIQILKDYLSRSSFREPEHFRKAS